MEATVALEPVLSDLKDDDQWVGVGDAAARLRINRQTAYRHLNAGTFPARALKVGRMWRIDLADLDRFLAIVDGRKELR